MDARRPSAVHRICRAILRYALRAWLIMGVAASAGATHKDLQLLGQLDLPAGGGVTDVWGYVDALGREFALVGNNWVGIQVVEVTNPYNPILRATIGSVPRQDIKSWQHYVYTVDGNLNLQGSDGAILDFTDPLNPVVVGSIPPGHNLFIDEDGFLYVSYPGLKIFDLNPDPTAPQLVWEDSLTEGHDACVVNGRLYNFSGTDGTFIYDVTNHANPVPWGQITDPSIAFHHSGWVWYNDFLLLNDELAVDPAPDITVWLVHVPWTIARVGEFSDPTATIHNSYIIDDVLLAAYYTSGVRALDLTLPFAPVLLDEYDTTPLVGEGIFQGAWGIYPFSPAGHIFVSDRSNGLFVFDLEDVSTAVASQPTPDWSAPYNLAQNEPNPFNPVTTIRYRIPEAAAAELDIFDVRGCLVRRLVSEVQSGGNHEVVWDGRDERGTRLASGVYYYRLQSGTFEQTKRLVLLK